MVTRMDYPSTTQALFALIVMIIVLVFILVYCCWGTFACSKTQDFSPQMESSVRPRRCNRARNNRETTNHRALVILPYNNMLYIGDRETRRVYHFPVSPTNREDKPPSYRDLFTNLPPNYQSQEVLGAHNDNFDLPPTYNECLELLKDSRQTTEEMNKFIVASMEDLMNICDSLSNSGPSSHLRGLASPASFSASSEPVLSNLRFDGQSSSPLSKIKSNFFAPHLLKTRSNQSDVIIESGICSNQHRPLSNPPPHLSKTLDNLTLSAENLRPIHAASSWAVSNTCSEGSQDLENCRLSSISEISGNEVERISRARSDQTPSTLMLANDEAEVEDSQHFLNN